MRPALPVLALAAAQLCMGQSRAYIRTVPSDLGDLNARISGSVFVVRGYVQDVKYVDLRVHKRLVDEPDHIVEVRSTDDLARLVTVAIDQVFCRQSDFAPVSSPPTAVPSSVKMLIPRIEQPWKCVGPTHTCVGEEPNRGKEYLLFLQEDPRSATLSSIYSVEPGETYYRAVLGARGAVELPDAPETPSAPLLVAVTALCNALQPPDLPSKLARLKALSVTADPRWRGEVDRTIRALDAAQRAAQK
jgi:hypothetical protein